MVGIKAKDGPVFTDFSRSTDENFHNSVPFDPLNSFLPFISFGLSALRICISDLHFRVLTLVGFVSVYYDGSLSARRGRSQGGARSLST